MKAEGRRQKAERRRLVILSRADGEGSQDAKGLRSLRSFGVFAPQDDDARQSTSYFCLLPSAFCVHQLIAGQGTNIDQSSAARNPSSGGWMVLNVNANCDGPCSSRCLRRFFASSMPGMCPAGTHHIARYAPSKCSNQSRRWRSNSVCAVL